MITLQTILEASRDMNLRIPGEVRIVESEAMVDHVEDWSRVRSPGRARRRLRYGHKQNIRFITVPRKDAITIDGGRTYIMHPVVAQAMRINIKRKSDASFEHAFLKGDAP